MKIVINYDLLDKIAESSKGFSLKRCVKKTLYYSAISSLVYMGISMVTGDSSENMIASIISYVAFHSIVMGTFTWALTSMTKESAAKHLNEFVSELSDSCVKTDDNAILNSYTYKSKYNINFDSIITQIEQKKYIMIPVCDEDLEDKEVSIVQRHILGSNKYVISREKFEDKKVYTLGSRLLHRK